MTSRLSFVGPAPGTADSLVVSVARRARSGPLRARLFVAESPYCSTQPPAPGRPSDSAAQRCGVVHLIRRHGGHRPFILAGMVTVIIPAHNEARVIGRLLKCLVRDARPR